MSTGASPPASSVRVSSSVQVSVPATSANLGPGFDTLGLALDLRDELRLELTAGGLEVVPYGDVPTDERNLVVRAVRAGFAATGGQPDGVRLTYTARIPHSRGLGSSSAAICAGVAAALALRGEPADGELALRLAAELEGHPDNVAPCLSGGATIAWYPGGAAAEARAPARALRLDPVPELRPVVVVPAVRTSTERARAALPPTVSHGDAAFTAGRAALLVAALTSRPELLLDATDDRLHQPYRLPLVPVTAQLVRVLREAGVAAVLSGSGPTVLALCVGAAQAELAHRIAAGVLGDSGVPAEVLQPDVSRDGCRAEAI